MFDNVILENICKLIDDPKTFRSFALLSKKTYYISTLYKEDKMLQFCKEERIERGNTGCIEIVNRLPNGKRHGINKLFTSYMNLGNYFLYYNGFHLASYWLGENGIEFIRFYNCKCEISSSLDKEPKYRDEKVAREIMRKWNIIQDACSLSLNLKEKSYFKCEECFQRGVSSTDMYFSKYFP